MSPDVEPAAQASGPGVPSRGRLRVYLGAAPGVGKTYSMLGEAHRRLGRGTDVVVGFVESHGRPQTEAMVSGLEVVPRRTVEHRGARFEEMDLDAVLARRPEVALVDELAHTNIPGSRHTKRWQDIHDLLAAGIDVISTVNIQHLESLNDVVEAITGIKQRETVPDAVVRAADQLELVDMSPEALRRRLAHGNVYSPEKVDAALGNYFRLGNLTALRELALLWLADRVEEGLERYREQHGIQGTWAARPRIVVALTGGEADETLLRRGALIAGRSAGRDLTAVHVVRGDGTLGARPDSLARLRRLTEDLGGSFHTVVGEDVARAVLDFARSVNGTQVVVGTSRRGRVSTALRPSTADAIVRDSGDIDVHVVTHPADATGRSARHLRVRRTAPVLVLGRRGHHPRRGDRGAPPVAEPPEPEHDPARVPPRGRRVLARRWSPSGDRDRARGQPARQLLLRAARGHLHDLAAGERLRHRGLRARGSRRRHHRRSQRVPRRRGGSARGRGERAGVDVGRSAPASGRRTRTARRGARDLRDAQRSAVRERRRGRHQLGRRGVGGATAVVAGSRRRQRGRRSRTRPRPVR